MTDTISSLKRFSGVYVAGGEVRRLTFEARDIAEAKEMARQWNVGVEGEAAQIAPEPAPEAVNIDTACSMLGGVSRKTIYRDVAVGLLQRVPDTRRVLITRRSIEQRCGAR